MFYPLRWPLCHHTASPHVMSVGLHLGVGNTCKKIKNVKCQTDLTHTIQLVSGGTSCELIFPFASPWRCPLTTILTWSFHDYKLILSQLVGNLWLNFVTQLSSVVEIFQLKTRKFYVIIDWQMSYLTREYKKSTAVVKTHALLHVFPGAATVSQQQQRTKAQIYLFI